MRTEAPLLGEPLPVELMNTMWADRDGVHDALGTPAEATAWLRAIAARTPLDASEPVATRDVSRQLRELRDGLRRLAGEVTADPRDRARSPISDLTAAIATVNHAAQATPTWPALNWRGGEPTVTLKASGSATAALISHLAHQGVDFFAGDQRRQLRACLAPGCVLYFVKNHPRREWCSAACGNRARVARHYQRTHNRPAQ